MAILFTICTIFSCFTLLDIIGALNKNENGNNIKDVNLIKAFWKDLNIDSELVSNMSEEEQRYIYNVLKDPLTFTKFDELIKFSKKIGYILKDVDVNLYSKVISNYNAYLQQYVQLINQIDIPTEQTINNISIFMKKGKKEFELGENVLSRLIELEMFYEYIVARCMKENKLILEEIDIEKYIEVFNNTQQTRMMMLENQEFFNCIVQSGTYNKLKKEDWKYLYQANSNVEFIRFLLDNLSKNEIIEYIKY